MLSKTTKTQKILSKQEKESNEPDFDMDEMMKNGVHLGHKTSKLHPKMAEHVLGIRNTTHIIDLNKTSYYLNKALKFISEVSKEKGIILLIGTKIPIRSLVKKTAEDCDLPYVTERWLGGTLSNFEVIQKRVRYFKETEEKKKKGQLEKYTKKERVKIDHDLEKLRRKFEGIKNMEKIPDAVFICDIIKDKICLTEAKIRGIKTIAIIDTNADPEQVDYPIPANDDAITSVKYILEKIKDAIISAKS